MIIAYANRDPTKIVLWAEKNRQSEPAFVVADDGVRRSVHGATGIVDGMITWELIEPKRDPYGKIVSRSGTLIATSMSDAPGWARDLVLWGRKALRSGMTEAPSQAAKSSTRVVPCAVIGDMRVEKWTPALSKQSAHPLEEIIEITEAAVVECFNAWQWKPVGLTLGFHASGRAMGLAYSPGKGDRRISLAAGLLAAYDADSIFRTLLHELCHHAREELHPRTLEGRPSFLREAMAHDTVFCDMLAEVDATIRDNPTSCRFFNDDADPQAMAASDEKRGVVYTAAAGWIEIGVSPQYRMRYRWMPLKNGPHKWTSRWEPLTPESLGLLLDRFPPTERRAIVAQWSFDRGGKSKRVGNIESFVANATGHFRNAEKMKELIP